LEANLFFSLNDDNQLEDFNSNCHDDATATNRINIRQQKLQICGMKKELIFCKAGTKISNYFYLNFFVCPTGEVTKYATHKFALGGGTCNFWSWQWQWQFPSQQQPLILRPKITNSREAVCQRNVEEHFDCYLWGQ